MGSGARDVKNAENGQTIGQVLGIVPGATFEDRDDLYDSCVHRTKQAGVQGDSKSGARSIVLNGMYEDDDDQGEVIYYSGPGQDGNQVLEGGNQWLKLTYDVGRDALNKPTVRVIRGSKAQTKFAPTYGLRYDGEYTVEEAKQRRGKAGNQIWLFKLVRVPGQEPIQTQIKWPERKWQEYD